MTTLGEGSLLGNHDRKNANAKSRGLIRLGLTLQKQVAAILAAIGLAAMVSQIFAVGWYAPLATLVGYWDEYVRPITAWILDTLVSRPLRRVLGRSVDIPIGLRDYFSVGAILLASMLRANRIATRLINEKTGKGLSWYPRSLRSLLADVRVAIQIIALWPLYIFLLSVPLIIFGARRVTKNGQVDSNSGEMTSDFRRIFFVVIAPLVYFGLLVAINRFSRSS